MAKKPKGYYSPEAIQARQGQARDEYLERNKPAEQKPPQDPTQPGRFANVTVPPKPVESPFTVTPKDGSLDWDYKTAQTDMQGRPLEARTFLGQSIKPKAFDPNGNPYFGAGLKGWLQKWAYKMSEESATKKDAEDSWKQFWETSKQYSANATQNNRPKTPEEGQQRAKEQTALFLQGASQLWDASTKWAETIDVEGGSAPTGGFKSPITFALRSVNAAVGMTLEAFQFVSEIPERAVGAQKAMREYANEAGSTLPSLQFDPVDDEYYQRVQSDPKLKSMFAPDNGFKANEEAADVLSRLINPLLSGYDAIRFWTSPGSVEEKAKAIQNGWTEGRILYTELLKDTVSEEYKSRVKAGEDPVLLAMELEDPWIEAAGEMLFDPLNALGLMGKAKKAGDVAQEAARVVDSKIPANIAEDIKNLANATDDADSSQKLDRIFEAVEEQRTIKARQIAQANDFKARSFTPSANKIRARKTVGNYVSAVAQAFRNMGKDSDEVLDYLNAVRKLSSGDKSQFIDAIAVINKSPLPNMAFNDAAFETAHMLNSIMDESDFINQMQKQGGNFSDFYKWFDTKMEKATDFVYPSISELSKAADKAKELGDAAKAKDINFAQRFAELKKTNPGVVKFAQLQSVIESVVKPINGFLANSYFSLSYGYAFRNAIQNMFTLWIDGGITLSKENALQFSKNGVSTPGMDNFLISQFGEIPTALRGKTLTQSVTEGSLAEKFFGKLNSWGYSPAALADAAEVYAGKMIYIKKYRETMDKVLDFGGALPKMEVWENAGFTASQATDFKDLLRASNYNTTEAITAFAKKYGDGTVDKWRMLDWVNPEAKKGLQEYENVWDDLYKFLNNGDPSQDEVVGYIEKLKAKIKQNAGKVVNETPRLDPSDPIAKTLMDDAEEAGKFYPVDADNAFINMKIQANRAVNEFEDALRKVLGDNNTPADLKLRIQKVLSDTPREAEAKAIETDEIRRWVVDRRNRAGKENPAALWDEAVMGQKPKAGIITRDQFLQHLWEKYYFPKRREIWNTYYTNKFKAYMEFANANPELANLFEKANLENLKFQQYADYVYSGNKVYTRPPVINPSKLGEEMNASNARALANAYGISVPTTYQKDSQEYILQVVNKYSGQKYENLKDVPLDVAEKAFSTKTGQPVKHFVKKFEDGFISNDLMEGLPVRPAYDPLTSPGAHGLAETEDGYIQALNHIRDGIKERWGMKQTVKGINPQSILADLTERIAISKSKAQIVAEKYRDFALLPYGETTNMDFAMSLVYPYQFWYSRSYKNWMQRAFMTNPEIISRYANLKEAMAQEQKDLPDWWKSQLNVTPGLRLLGIDPGHPVYINLEASLFPLYGLTGTDFNDPQKRVDWWTATLDDMGKFGPSVWAPLQIATALKLALDGENDAAARWGGRLIPQTASVKSISSFFGTPIEIDPVVNFFGVLNGQQLGRATDPYEEKRIGRALSKMEADGIPEELLIEAARTRQGDLWNQAYQAAVQERAPGQLASFLFGVGFKGRSQEDAEIDQFYNDYFRMQNLRDGGYLTKDEYAQSFNDMRERYPFMDILLLSRRAGEGKDSAYAYNILSRIPPGASSEILKAAGVDPDTAAKFYDGGGKFEDMTETEKARFMAGMVDLGAMLSIPSNATREEWTAIRARYNQIQELQKQRFGDDILDRIDEYYSLQSEADKKAFKAANPEVFEAMDFKTQMIVNDPYVSQYYGGINALERYYNSLMYDKLEKTYGAEIFDLEEQYYNILNPKEKKQFKRQHPELDKYFKDKNKYKDENQYKIIQFGSLLPPAPQLQPGFEPQTAQQEDVLNVLSQSQIYPMSYWQANLGPQLTEIMAYYIQTGEDMPYYARQELEYQAQQLGMSEEQLLVNFNLSMGAGQ